jgi:hypothetical protein
MRQLDILPVAIVVIGSDTGAGRMPRLRKDIVDPIIEIPPGIRGIAQMEFPIPIEWKMLPLRITFDTNTGQQPENNYRLSIHVMMLNN